MPTPACLLDGALAAAIKVNKADFRDWALGDVAVAQAAAGYGSAALATAARMGDPRLLIAALNRIARAQAETGNFDNARAIARAIPDVRVRAESLNAVAATQLEAGDEAGARATLSRALRAAAVAEPEPQAFLLSEIAVVQAKSGDPAGAFASLNEARDRAGAANTAAGRARALSRVATAMAEIGRIDEALAMVENIGEARHRTPVLILAAVAQAETGDVPLALETIAAIEDTHHRVVALDKVALVQARAGATAAARSILARARAAIDKINYGYARAYALSRIALTETVIGTVGDVLELSKQIVDKALRARTLWTASAAQARFGDKAAAQRSAALALAATDMIEDPLGRLWLLSDIAVARSRAGDESGARALFDRTLEYAEAMTTPWLRARALSRLATALVEMRLGAAVTPAGGLGPEFSPQ